MCVGRILLSVLSGFMIPMTSSAVVKVGDIPSGVAGIDAAGHEIHLDDYKGKIVLLSFFASWCAPCREELPTLEKIQKLLGKDKIEVIVVDWQESSPTYHRIRRALSSYTLTFARDENGDVGEAFSVDSLPRLYIIDRQGKVAFVHEGYSDASIDSLAAELNALLGISQPGTAQ